jgi:hypothetical protein
MPPWIYGIGEAVPWGENGPDNNMCIVGDTQLITDGQDQRIGLGDGLVPPELAQRERPARSQHTNTGSARHGRRP